MTPKRGQPPKSPEDRKDSQIGLRVTEQERSLLENAYHLSGTAETFSRWMIGISLEEAQKIVDSHRK